MNGEESELAPFEPMPKRAGAPKRGRGRPPVDVDLKLLGQLMSVPLTDEERASCLGISPRTWHREKKRPEIREILETGQHLFTANIKRAQVRSALKGNHVIQIWLGKVYCGQRDPATIPPPAPPVNAGIEMLVNLMRQGPAPPVAPESTTEPADSDSGVPDAC